MHTLAAGTRQKTVTHRSRSLTTYARLLGAVWDVVINFTNKKATASTDRKSISMIPLDLGDDEDALVVEGLIDHEAGVHCRLSDFSVLAERRRTISVLECQIANIAEDLWGERELYAVKPGCAKTIHASLRILQARHVFAPPSLGMHPANVLLQALSQGLRLELLGQTAFEDTAPLHRANAEFLFGAETYQRVLDVMAEVKYANSTVHSFDIAARVMEVLKSSCDPNSQGMQPPSQGDAGPQVQGDRQQAQAGQPGGDQPKPDQSPPEGSPAKAADAKGNGSESGEAAAGSDGASGTPGDGGDAKAPGEKNAQPGSQGSSDAGDPSQPRPQPGESPAAKAERQSQAIKDAMNASPEQAGDNDLGDKLQEGLRAGKSACGAGDQWNATYAIAKEKPQYLQTLQPIAHPLTVRLGSRLEQYLLARTMDQVHYAKAGRKLASRMIPAIYATGRTRVFVKHEEADRLSTAVAILTDTSASMKNPLQDRVNAIEAAMATTQALGSVLDRFSIPFSVDTFGSRITSLKRFEQRWAQRKATFHDVLENSTVAHKALAEVVPRLGARPEDRRLLVLIMDGIPSDVQRTVVTLCEARAAGMDVAIFLITHIKAGGTLDKLTDELNANGLKYAKACTASELADGVFRAIKAVSATV